MSTIWSAIQPAPVPNRKGMLTHPAWLVAHAFNTETDPVHRGKFVREKLLAGTIPDVDDAYQRLLHFRENGPSERAWPISKPVPPPSE